MVNNGQNGFRKHNNNLHSYCSSKTKGVMIHVRCFVFMNFKSKLGKKHKHTMNQFWFGDNQCVSLRC